MTNQKLKIYLDTSVLSVFDDPRILERQSQTRDFWKTLKNFKVCISQITINKINKTPKLDKKKKLLKLTKKMKILPITEKAEKLAGEYIKKNVIPEKFIEDALHLAIATINKIPILVSWNCKHLVNLKTKFAANKINLANGYKSVELVQPPMVS